MWRVGERLRQAVCSSRDPMHIVHSREEDSHVGEYFPGERAASAPSAPSPASVAAGSLSSHLASGNGPPPMTNVFLDFLYPWAFFFLPFFAPPVATSLVTK